MFPNEYKMIQSKWNIRPEVLDKFMKRFPDDVNSNNCRYDLVFSWG